MRLTRELVRSAMQVGVVCCTVLGAAGSSADTPSGVESIRVGAGTHVSRESPADMHMQVLVATNPVRPGELAAVSNHQLQNIDRTISTVYLSRDAGRTWAAVFTGDDGTDDTDPTVAYGPDGTLYFAYIGHPPGRAAESVVFHSRDSGRTWVKPVKFDILDRHFLSVDTTQSRYRGRVYLAGAKGGREGGLLLRYSADGGETFSDVAKFRNAEGRMHVNHSPGVVLSDGTVVFLSVQVKWDPQSDVYGEWPHSPNAQVLLVRSQDGGATLSLGGMVSDGAVYSNVLSASNDFSALAVDASTGPFRDRLYSAYTRYDWQTGRRDIMLAYSMDKGTTWSKPIAVNDDPLQADLTRSAKHFMPTLAVNHAGVVGITWYDRRDSGNGLDFRLRFAASLDGGVTFLPSTLVSGEKFAAVTQDAPWNVRTVVEGGGSEKKYLFYRRGSLRDGRPLNLQFIVPSTNFFTQHTAGLTADNTGVFHAMWVDNRGGLPQVWAAPITVPGSAIRHGSPELADLDDVTDEVAIHYGKIHYDRRTHLLSVEAQIENVTEQALHGPVVLRVISTVPRGRTVPPSSGQGEYRIQGSDNGQSGAGAVWRFQGADERLLPNQRSGMRRLEFMVTAEPALSRASQLGTYNGGFLSLVELDARAFARRDRKPSR